MIDFREKQLISGKTTKNGHRHSCDGLSSLKLEKLWGMDEFSILGGRRSTLLDSPDVNHRYFANRNPIILYSLVLSIYQNKRNNETKEEKKTISESNY